MKLIIITPCYRIFNLPLVYLSIKELKGFDLEWHIALDKASKEYFAADKIIKAIGDPRIVLHRPMISHSFVGHSLRNYVLDYLEKVESEEYYVYQLDDDTIMHENFSLLSQWISPYSSIYNVHVFDQAYRDGGIRLTPSQHVTFGQCDTGTFLAPSRAIKGLRYNETEYAGDFLYIQELYKKYPMLFAKHLDVPASYYNWITDIDLTFKH